MMRFYIAFLEFIHGAYSSAGRAPDLHSGGQRFDPAIPVSYTHLTLPTKA